MVVGNLLLQYLDIKKKKRRKKEKEKFIDICINRSWIGSICFWYLFIIDRRIGLNWKYN